MKQWKRYTFEQQFLFILRRVIGGTALIAVTLLIIDYGMYTTSKQQDQLETGYVVIGVFFLLGYILQLIIRRDRWNYLKTNTIKYFLTALMLLEILVVYGLHKNLAEMSIFQGLRTLTFRDPHILFVQFYLVVNILRWVVKLSQYLAQYNSSPSRFILLSFGGAILLGTGLLLLPKATTTPLKPIDALFTATSAICVTGLIVVDTATAFTRLGQLIILSLIQIGGLGIMTVTAFFALIVGRRMSGREQVLLGDMLDTNRLARLGSIIRTVFFTTVIIEACGVGLLYLSWREYFPQRRCLYTALFHSISAFCNAGFSIFSDSLMGFATNIRINLIICGLIIVGGLGFGTLRNLGSVIVAKCFRKRVTHLSIQSKLVLLTTACLLFLGMLLFFIIEQPNALRSFSFKDQVLGSFFQSVTFRTAGFNTVDFSNVHESSLLLGIMFMFIGAAPGSTGGGIKVTTLVILLATVFSASRGRTRLELFHRTIPITVLYQTLVVITMYLLVMMVVSFLLSITEAQFRPIELLFETVSALATVGLSTGLTSELSGVGKILIIITMFLGRLGPFTIALAIGQRQRGTERYRYPEERVQIG